MRQEGNYRVKHDDKWTTAEFIPLVDGTGVWYLPGLPDHYKDSELQIDEQRIIMPDEKQYN